MGNIGIDVSKEELARQCREGLKIINDQRKENEKLSAEVEQLRVQLAGCAVAALGGTDPKQSQVAKKGDYGWSPAYQEVLDLRIKYDKAQEKVKSLHDRLDEAYRIAGKELEG